MPNETVLDVLEYIYDNYLSSHNGIAQDERPVTTAELEEAGFSREGISRTLLWLDGLVDFRLMSEQVLGSPTENSTRIFSVEENAKLNEEAQGHLYFLENIGILSAMTREMVIDRAIALEGNCVDKDQLSWVVLLVLYNSPGHQAQFCWMEDYVFGQTVGIEH